MRADGLTFAALKDASGVVQVDTIAWGIAKINLSDVLILDITDLATAYSFHTLGVEYISVYKDKT